MLKVQDFQNGLVKNVQITLMSVNVFWWKRKSSLPCLYGYADSASIELTHADVYGTKKKSVNSTKKNFHLWDVTSLLACRFLFLLLTPHSVYWPSSRANPSRNSDCVCIRDAIAITCFRRCDRTHWYGEIFGYYCYSHRCLLALFLSFVRRWWSPAAVACGSQSSSVLHQRYIAWSITTRTPSGVWCLWA
jgi:hypothetical protein